MKAAAAAWNASPRLFAQGLAARTSDPAATRAALEHPGTVLGRPHGQNGPYLAHPGLPQLPAPSPDEKKKVAEARQRHRLKQAKERSEKARAERQAREAARQELTDLDRQESALRKKRQTLERQLHLHGH